MDESRPVHPRAGATTDVEVVRVEGGRAERRADAVAVEEPLEVRVDGETVAVTMRTPGADSDLALGFLFSEGMIDGAGDVGSASHCGRPGEEGYGNVVDVRSAGGHRIDVERVLEGRRWSTTTSACGVCGRRSIDGLLARCSPVGDAPAASGGGDPALHGAALRAAAGLLADRRPPRRRGLRRGRRAARLGGGRGAPQRRGQGGGGAAAPRTGRAPRTRPGPPARGERPDQLRDRAEGRRRGRPGGGRGVGP